MADIGPIDGAFATVNSALSGAHEGDRILINAGNYSWGANHLVINKNVSIIGAGMDKTSVKPRPSVATIINSTYAAGGGKYIDATYTQSATTKRISGIVFSLTSAASSVISLNGTSYMYVDVDGTTVRGGVRLDNLRFVVPSESWTMVSSASNGADLSTMVGAGVINVADTTNFASSGQLSIQTGAQTKITISYTNTTPTSFTGVTGGNGVIATGYTVATVNTNISDSVFLLQWGNTAQPDYLTGSFDHNFVDFSPFTGGSESMDFNCQGNPTGGPVNTTQYGLWSWNQPYIYGGGLAVNGAYDCIYVEDNIFHKSMGMTDSTHGGGNIVFRNNTTWAHLQTHGMESGNDMGPHAVETLYNLCDNTRAIPKPVGTFFPGRGGGQIYYGNRFIGFDNNSNLPYQIEAYRATAQTSIVGVGDGKNIFDNNQTGNFTDPVTHINWTVKASGGAGTGDIYERSNGGHNPISSFVVAQGAPQVTIHSSTALNQTTNAYAGFVLINLNTTGPDGEQLLGAANDDVNASSYSLITSSVGVGGGDVKVSLQSTVNTAFSVNSKTTVAAGSNGVNVNTFAGAGVLNVASTTGFPINGGTVTVPTAAFGTPPVGGGLASISYTGITATTLIGCQYSGIGGILATGNAVTCPFCEWEMRRVIQYFCAPGAYSTPKQLSGNNKNGPLCQFTDGTKGWFGQQVFGIWQKDNGMKITAGTVGYSATPLLSSLAYSIISPCVPHDNALPGAGAVGVAAGGYPSTAAPHRVGADWEAPGGFSEAIASGSGDAPPFTVGPPYPNPIIAGTVGGTPTQPPVITSSLTDNATIGSAYSYTITASNTPTSFSTGTLPSGLSLSGAVISGTTPGQPGTYSITINASNAGGTGTATLVLTVTGTNQKGRLPHIGKKSMIGRRRTL